MGAPKEDNRDIANHYYKRIRGVAKTWIACLGSFSISGIGGLILTWWELRYHPRNSQLWMVPFGLILLITPVIVWSSILVSYIFNGPGPGPGEENSSSLRNVRSGDIP